MKKSAQFVVLCILTTLAMYLGIYFFLPPPPTPKDVTLLAMISICLVTGVQFLLRRKRSQQAASTKPKKTKTVLSFLTAALLPLLFLTPSRLMAADPCSASPEVWLVHHPDVSRQTGVASLFPLQDEDTGYGLYSYLLLAHKPDDNEQARYEAIFKVLYAMPDAKGVAISLCRVKINITYVPLAKFPNDWGKLSDNDQIKYLVTNYNYAHATGLIGLIGGDYPCEACIVSFLHPLNSYTKPKPILYQELSRVDPAVLSEYIKDFKARAAQERFWEKKTLTSLRLALRNDLEIAATGLGMSQDAVMSMMKSLFSKNDGKQAKSSD